MKKPPPMPSSPEPNQAPTPVNGRTKMCNAVTVGPFGQNPLLHRS